MNEIYRIPSIQGCCFPWLAQVLKAESGRVGTAPDEARNVRAARTASACPLNWRLQTQRAENVSIR